MTECDEVAAAMLGDYQTYLTEGGVESTPAHARVLVDKKMPDEESATIRGNVAESLHIQRRQQEQALRLAYLDIRNMVDYWEQRGVIVTVTRESQQPLAMRNTIAAIDTRLKRGN